MLGELNRALHGLTYSLQINRKPQRRCEAEPGVFARVTTFLRLVGEMRECGELIAVHISEQEDVRYTQLYHLRPYGYVGSFITWQPNAPGRLHGYRTMSE